MVVAIDNSDMQAEDATPKGARRRSRRERAARLALPREVEYALIRDDLIRLVITAAIVMVIMIIALFALT